MWGKLLERLDAIDARLGAGRPHVRWHCRGGPSRLQRLQMERPVVWGALYSTLFVSMAVVGAAVGVLSWSAVVLLAVGCVPLALFLAPRSGRRLKTLYEEWCAERSERER